MTSFLGSQDQTWFGSVSGKPGEAQWCLIQSYLISARNHDLTVLDAITRALAGKPWLPEPIPA